MAAAKPRKVAGSAKQSARAKGARARVGGASGAGTAKKQGAHENGARAKAGGGAPGAGAAVQARPARPARPLKERLRDALAALERGGSKAGVAGYARYGVTVVRAWGTPMNKVQAAARACGRDHELAQALWDSGWHEARLMAPYVADPALVTPAQMDAWTSQFDNWATCDTACFVLFDRTPHAFGRITAWARLRDEFGRRAAFALLASVALHDKAAPDSAFLRCLPLAERAATDERNFVKKAVSWALRGIGSRSPDLHAATMALSERLVESQDATARWVGRDVIRDISRPLVVKRAAKRAEKQARQRG